MNVTFIGGGNMATALIGGLIARGHPASAIKVVEILHEARARVAEQFGVACFASAGEAAPLGDLVVFAVKPQQMAEVARETAPHLREALALSIAAGIRLDDLRRWLGGKGRLARCMPNTPALIGLGVTAVFAEPGVSVEGREAIGKVLESAGKLVWVEEESLLDPVTALSGSGPAYIFYFIEAMEQAGIEMGLSPTAARQLAIETAVGASALAARSLESPAILRSRVTSKGGTTERALESMRADGVGEAIVRAIHAANARAKELGAEFGKN